MVTMRRTGIFLLAAGYGLAFLAVCLGVCLAETPAAEHACCDGEGGLRAAARDCCVITQAVSPATTHATAAGSFVALPLHYEAVSLSIVAVDVAPVALTASPPLVLRI
jgi:hypothetical protein